MSTVTGTRVAATWGNSRSRDSAPTCTSASSIARRAMGDLETVEAVMASLRKARENGDLKFPKGNFELQAVGSFQNQIEANLRLMWIVPMVIMINLLLHYLHFRSFPISLVVFSGIPFAAAGGMIAVATNGLETEAKWNTCSGVSRSSTPTRRTPNGTVDKRAVIRPGIIRRGRS